MATPRRVRSGEPIAANDYNDLVDYAVRNTVRAGAGVKIADLPNGKLISLDEKEDKFLGVIVCCGDCENLDPCDAECDGCDEPCCPDCCDGDFTDNRYWIVREKLTNNGDGHCARPATEKLPPCDIKYQKVVALNYAEDNCKSHLLPPGTKVEVSVYIDSGTPFRRRYVFTRTPMPKEDQIDECTDAKCDCEPSSSSSSSSPSSSSSSKSSSSKSDSKSDKSGSTDEPSHDEPSADKPSSGGSKGSGSSSSSSGDSCCDCYEITINGGEKHQLNRNTNFSKHWAGDGYILTYDGKWILGGPDIGAEAADESGDCPPLVVAQWTPTAGGGLEDIRCCQSSSSDGASSSGSSPSASGGCDKYVCDVWWDAETKCIKKRFSDGTEGIVVCFEQCGVGSM